MRPTLLVFALLLLAADESTPARRASSIAPSLPALTKEEEAKIEDAIDRFIQADTGRLRGEEGRKAIREFEKLGPEAIPSLIRGLNTAAKINHSCPVLMITKKLQGLLTVSNDVKLLDFARDEIGAGLGKIPHSRVLQDLRFRLTLRRNALASRPALSPKGPAATTTPDLIRSLGVVRGEQMRGVIAELAKRDDKDALTGLTWAANNTNADTQKMGREGLDTNLARQSASFIQEKMGDSRAEVRKSAVRVGVKHEELVVSVIERLTDENAGVRAEARKVLMGIEKGVDYGPAPGATKDQQREAQSSWRQWWLKRAMR